MKEITDGWIEWKGGECPVDPRADVICRFAMGYETPVSKAGGYYWSREGAGGDIIAYRVVTPSEDAM